MTTKAELKKAYITLIKQHEPYSHQLTLTFNQYYSEYDLDRIRYKFMDRLNRRIFGKNNKTDKIEYVSFKEYKNRNVPHYHILLKYDDKFYEKNKPTIEEHVEQLIDKFRHITRFEKEFRFRKKHNDLTIKSEDDWNYGYFTKEYWKNNNFDFVELNFKKARC